MTYTFADAQRDARDQEILEEYERQQAEQIQRGLVDVPGADQQALEALEAAGPPQPAREPFREFTGEKYEAREDGGTRQTDDYNRYLRAERRVKEFQENPIVQTLQGASDVAGSIVQGLGDTAIGLGTMTEPISPGVFKKYIKPFWHEQNPESDNPINHTIRKLSGVVIPTIFAPGAITTRIAATPFAAALPGAVRTTGAVAARIGIDTTVVAASSSADDENAAKALNDAFGWQIPWATREGAGPDERRWYNLAENTGFAGFGELISGVFALRTYLKARPKKNMFEASWIHKHDIKKQQLLTEGAKPGTQIEWDPGLVAIPKTEEAVEQLTRSADNIVQQATSPAIKEIDDQINQLGLLDELGEAEELRLVKLVKQRVRIEVDEMAFDPLTRNIDDATKARTNSLADEAAERIQTNQGEYDPILHDPAEAQQRAVSSNTADVPGAMVDHHRILNDINTYRKEDT